MARENAERLGLPLEVSSGFGLPPGEYDLVLANLPYVREGEWAGMQPEIRGYEPREAFVSGPDGLDAIRELIEQAQPGTRLALEHGAEQAAAVRGLLERRRDLSGPRRLGAHHGGTRALNAEEVATFERCVVGRRRGAVSRRHRVRPRHRPRLERGRATGSTR